jgi:hypothetical protein
MQATAKTVVPIMPRFRPRSRFALRMQDAREAIVSGWNRTADLRHLADKERHHGRNPQSRRKDCGRSGTVRKSEW